MSEYQYYEFVAVDGPISDEGLRYARKCSSRAEVTPIRWRNTYHFGDFHGSVDTLLKHYDAHFYIANWGTVRLGFAFPEGGLDLEAVRAYARTGPAYDHVLTTRRAGNRCLVWWEKDEEGASSWTEGEGVLDRLLGLRANLLHRDYRALFLGWLSDFFPDQPMTSKEGSKPVPPIPPGLKQLNPALKTLIEHFPVDPDALEVAVDLSEPKLPPAVPVEEILRKLPPEEVRELLKRVLEGDVPKVIADLNRLTRPAAGSPSGPTLTCAEFAARALQRRQEREAAETRAKASRQQREEQDRRHHLASVHLRADTLWAGLNPLVEQRSMDAYDQAAGQLKDLRDAHAQAGESALFREKLAAFRQRFARRPAMLRRIAEL